MYEYGAAEILRRGYELAMKFPKCPVGTKRALQAAAEEAVTADKAIRAPIDNSTWRDEPHFSLTSSKPVVS